MSFDLSRMIGEVQLANKLHFKKAPAISSNLLRFYLLSKNSLNAQSISQKINPLDQIVISNIGALALTAEFSLQKIKQLFYAPQETEYEPSSAIKFEFRREISKELLLQNYNFDLNSSYMPEFILEGFSDFFAAKTEGLLIETGQLKPSASQASNHIHRAVKYAVSNIAKNDVPLIKDADKRKLGLFFAYEFSNGVGVDIADKNIDYLLENLPYYSDLFLPQEYISDFKQSLILQTIE